MQTTQNHILAAHISYPFISVRYTTMPQDRDIYSQNPPYQKEIWIDITTTIAPTSKTISALTPDPILNSESKANKLDQEAPSSPNIFSGQKGRNPDRH